MTVTESSPARQGRQHSSEANVIQVALEPGCILT
jgi:hypothetical protein